MLIKRRTTVHSVSRRLTTIRSGAKGIPEWCRECASQVQMLAPDEAAVIARVTSRTIFRWVEAGQIHFAETSDGLILICLNSLGKADQNAVTGGIQVSNKCSLLTRRKLQR